MGIFFSYCKMLQSHLVLLMTSVDVPILHKAILYIYLFCIGLFTDNCKNHSKKLDSKKKNVTQFFRIMRLCVKNSQESRTCGKGVVDTVEGDGVDWVHIFDSLLLQSVALEGVLLLLNFLARVQVLHSDAAFD